jgi:hypothetical protein
MVIPLMLLFGAALGIYGIVGIKKREVGIYLSKAPGAGQRAEFKGASAVSFGIIIVISGLIILLPPLYSILAEGTSLSDGELSIALGAGIVFLVGGFFFVAIIQAAINIGEELGAKRKKKR